MISLSLCMIVKNEEKVLPRILTLIKEVADKILICDTGSADNTKEIARELQQKFMIFHGKMISLQPETSSQKRSGLITGCGWMQTI